MSDDPDDPAGSPDRAGPGDALGADGGDDPPTDRMTDPAGGGTDPDGPLSGLAERVRRARSERGSDRDPFAALERAAGGDDDAGDPATGAPDTGTGLESGATGDPDADGDPFETMDVDAVDEASVWASLTAEDADPAESSASTTTPDAVDQPAVGIGGDAERIERDDPHPDRRDHAVPKDSYCQRCEFFAAPPEVRCSREGTEVVEVLDSERFRVRGCPMVERGGATRADGRRD